MSESEFLDEFSLQEILKFTKKAHKPTNQQLKTSSHQHINDYCLCVPHDI